MRRDVAERAESAYQRTSRGAYHCAYARRLSADGGRQKAARVDLPAHRMGQAMGSRRDPWRRKRRVRKINIKPSASSHDSYQGRAVTDLAWFVHFARAMLLFAAAASIYST